MVHLYITLYILSDYCAMKTDLVTPKSKKKHDAAPASQANSHMAVWQLDCELGSTVALSLCG